MLTREGEEITSRFHEALRELQARRVIRSRAAFAARYGINAGNLYSLATGTGTARTAQLDWLLYLVRDYGVSAHWLITGEGFMLPRRKVEREGEKGDGKKE